MPIGSGSGVQVVTARPKPSGTSGRSTHPGSGVEPSRIVDVPTGVAPLIATVKTSGCPNGTVAAVLVRVVMLAARVASFQRGHRDREVRLGVR